METRARQLNHYKGFIEKHPEGGFKTVGWSSQEIQCRAYCSALGMFGEDGDILDVGCGTGDYCDQGIDILHEMIEIARRNNPEGHYQVADILEYTQKHDYLMAIGTYNVSIGNAIENWAYMAKVLDKMWGLCRKGIAVNLLMREHNWNRVSGLEYRSWAEWSQYCFSKLSHNIKLDIVDHTFTLGVFK